MAVARFLGLSYSYPGAVAPALAELRFDIPAGITLVAGPSGSGKSTLLRALNGLVPHFHGGVMRGTGEVDGLPIPATPTRLLARHVGFVFQDVEAQFVYGTVAADVAFGLENIAIEPRQMRSRVGEALERAGIAALHDRRIATLSGGEKQRVALAAALALRPAIIALDEPGSQLDDEGARALAEACRELRASGCAVVVAEHRLERMLPLADHVLLGSFGHFLEPRPPGRLGAELEALLPGTRPTPNGHRRPEGPAVWEMSGVALDLGRRRVVEAVDLGGRAGEVVVLMGPNGSGKTTCLRAIAGLLKPAAGTVSRIDGRVAYLPQDPTAILHQRTLTAEIELTLRREGSQEPAGPYLERVGLGELVGATPGT